MPKTTRRSTATRTKSTARSNSNSGLSRSSNSSHSSHSRPNSSSSHSSSSSGKNTFSLISLLGWILIIVLLLIWFWCWWANTQRRPCWLCGTTPQTFDQSVDLSQITCLEDESNLRLEVATTSALPLPATNSATSSAR